MNGGFQKGWEIVARGLPRRSELMTSLQLAAQGY